MDWFSGAMAPFTVALLVAAGLVALEVIGLLLGMVPSDMLEGALDLDVDGDSVGDADGVSGGPLGWLGMGRVPLLVLIMALAVSFGVAGLIVQGAADAVLGSPLAGWLASLPALALALPATRAVASGVARVLPQVETEASEASGFVGRVATLGPATARPGLPAEAKLTDAHGQAHYVRVVPAEGGELTAGSAVLLIAREGAVFSAVPDPSAR